MYLRRALVLAVTLALAAACGGKQPEPAKPAPAGGSAAPVAQPKPSGSPADEAGALAMVLADKLVKAIDDAGGDCAKMGTNLQTLIGEMKAESAREKELEKDPEQQKAFKEKYEPQLNEKTKDALPKFEKCLDDPGVRAFLESMGT